MRASWRAAIARYVVRAEDPRKGVLIGYDHRYTSDRVAAEIAEVFSSTGTPVWLTDKPCPTPAISLLVRQRNAAGGIVVTASHNPYSWNGIKYKASYGSSALPSIVAQIEKELVRVQANGVPPLPPRKELIHSLDPRTPYLDTIEKLVDWQRLRDAKFRFVVDPMHGSAAGLLHRAFCRGMESPAKKFAAHAIHVSAAFIPSQSSRTSMLCAKRFWLANLTRDLPRTAMAIASARSIATARSSIPTRFSPFSSGTSSARASFRATLPKLFR